MQPHQISASHFGLEGATRAAAAAVFCLFLMAGPLWAQTITGTISGTVVDASGAALPAATITVTQVSTRTTRLVSTDQTGHFLVPLLPVGEYTVKAEHQEFSAEVRTGINLTVNEVAVINFTLKVGEVTSTITVQEGAPSVDTTTSQITGLVTGSQIRELPLNGRDFLQLAELNPGVTPTFNVGINTFGGRVSKYVVNGLRPTMNGYLIDGTDISSSGQDPAPPGGASGVALGVEAIQEFRVLTNNFSAEYGRSAGSIVNAISRSGTNNFHGSLYEFLRNDNLDARNFFDQGSGPPPFKRNQFGFTVGGAAIKDKTFFFVNYEGLRERLGVTSVATVPDALARQGQLSNPANPGTFISVPVNPQIKPFLDLYPLPNGPSNGDGTATLFSSGTQPTDEDFFVVKVDHSISQKHSFMARYTFDDSDSKRPFASTFVPGFPSNIDRRNQYLTLNLTSVFTQNFLNVVRFGYSRTFKSATPALAPAGLSTSLIPNRPFLGSIEIAGLDPLGNSTLLPFLGVTNVFQVSDDMTLIRNRHSMKWGLNIVRFQFNDTFDLLFNGSFTFTGLKNFLANKANTFLGFLPGSTSDRGFRNTLYNFYFQDDFRVHPGLTLNLGLRYEYNTVPTEVHGKLTNIRNPKTDTQVTVGGPLFESAKKSFAPRFGFAWDVFGNATTSVRGGFGIFYDQIFEPVYGNTRFQPPFANGAFVPAPPFPNASQGRVIPTLFIQAVDSHIKPSYAMQYNLTVERELFRSTFFRVGYVGTRGVRLLRVLEANTALPTILPDGTRFFPANSRRQNPKFGPIRLRTSDSQSNYNALQMSVQRRAGQALQLQASYTYSKAIDDSSGVLQTDFIGAPVNSMDPDRRTLDRSLSSFDARHNFTLSYTYALPFGAHRHWLGNLTGPGQKLIEGWQVSGIVTLQSGNPFTPVIGFNRSGNLQTGTGVADRPNLALGASNNPVLDSRDPQRFFDVKAFTLQPAGFFGNLGRNTLIGPGLANVDFSVSKSNQVKEKYTVLFRVDFFNLFNRANFAVPSNVGAVAASAGGGDIIFADTSGVPVGSAGKIFRTVTTSRQIQISAKFVF